MVPDAHPRDRLTAGEPATPATGADSRRVRMPIVGPAESPPPGRYVAEDGHRAPAGREGDCWRVVDRAADSLVGAFIEAGYHRVLLGDEALRSTSRVSDLAARFGADRLGLMVRCVRAEVGWSLETESNADFRYMRPTRCEPDWEIATSAGVRTGALAQWWLGEMFDRGAGVALLCADIVDDADLNIAAGLVETFGDRLWFAPRTDRVPDLEACTRWGRVARWAFPTAMYRRLDAAFADAGVPSFARPPVTAPES